MLCLPFDINLCILKQDFFHLGFLRIARNLKGYENTCFLHSATHTHG